MDQTPWQLAQQYVWPIDGATDVNAATAGTEDERVVANAIFGIALLVVLVGTYRFASYSWGYVRTGLLFFLAHCASQAVLWAVRVYLTEGVLWRVLMLFQNVMAELRLGWLWDGAYQMLSPG